MKILIAVIAFQAFLLITEAKSIPSEKSKRVACYFAPSETFLNETLAVEDIDASICTHLVVDDTALRLITAEYFLRKNNITDESNRPIKVLEKFHQLKEMNSDLKLIAQVPYWSLGDIHNIWGAEESRNISLDAVNLVKILGFDGLEFQVDIDNSQIMNAVTKGVCEIRADFEKHGYEITNNIGERSPGISIPAEIDYSQLAKCFDHFAIVSVYPAIYFTQRFTSISVMKEDVEKYIQRGIPADKILITIPAFGNFVALADPANNGLGAEINWERCPTISDSSMPGLVFNKYLTIELNNSSLGWTFRRDEETKEPYAFTKTGLWASYEDRISVEAKAKYVLENGLGGIAIMAINTEDIEGVSGEGRFPVTRAAFNALQKGLQIVDSNS